MFKNESSMSYCKTSRNLHNSKYIGSKRSSYAIVNQFL